MKKRGNAQAAPAAWLTVLTLALAGCTFGPPAREAPAVYDLGPPRSYAPSNPPIRAALLIPAASAPSWLDSHGIVYRLAYHDAARPQTYSASRWAAPPAALLTQRLRSRFAAAAEGGIAIGTDGARADYALHVELEDFSQSLDTPGSSRVGVMARATLVRLATRALVAQRTFAADLAAPSTDAPGAARALAEASDRIIEEILEWTRKSLGTARAKPAAGG